MLMLFSTTPGTSCPLSLCPLLLTLGHSHDHWKSFRHKGVMYCTQYDKAALIRMLRKMSTTNLHLHVTYHLALNGTDLTCTVFRTSPRYPRCPIVALLPSHSLHSWTEWEHSPAARITTGCGDTVPVTAAFGAR